MNITVSVIIPIYNRARTISVAIDSLLSQSFKDFEIILINDGSTDNTEEVLEKYIKQDKRIKLFIQENSGVSSARNLGLRMSEGQYITFLDSDDFYDPTYLEELYIRIQEKDAEICFCGYNKIYEGTKVKNKTVFTEKNVLTNYLFGKLNVHISGWMIKKELLELHGLRFTEGLSWGEDVEFICKVLLNSNKLTYVQDYLTNYTMDTTANNLSAFSLDKIDKDVQSLLNVLEYKNAKSNHSDLHKAILGYRLPALIIYRLNEALKQKNTEEIIEYYEKYFKFIQGGVLFYNGLRSVKLFIYKLTLKYRMLKIRR